MNNAFLSGSRMCRVMASKTETAYNLHPVLSRQQLIIQTRSWSLVTIWKLIHPIILKGRTIEPFA